MHRPLSKSVAQFVAARDSYAYAALSGDTELALTLAIAALQHADAILTHLGYAPPYECGACSACRAKAAARHAEFNAHLSAADEQTARRLLSDAFDTNHTEESE